MKKIVSLAFITLTVLLSCSKDDSEPRCSISVENIAGSYKMVSAKYQEQGSGPETDYLPELFPRTCEMDDIFVFKTDGTVTITDAGEICSPPTTDMEALWLLSGNKITMYDVDPQGEDQATVDFLECKSKMTWTYTDYDVTGDKLVCIFIRQ